MATAPAPAVANKTTGAVEHLAPQQPGTSIARTPLSDKPGAFRIAPLHDPMRKQYLNAMFYAPPGAGKTSLAGTAADIPQMRDVLLITAEGGEMVLEDNPRIKHSEFIDSVKVDRIEQFQKIYEMLQHHCRLRDKGDIEGMATLQRMTFGYPEDFEFSDAEDDHYSRLRRFNTVILDSLTEIEAMNLGKILSYDQQGLDAADEFQVAGYPEFRKNMHTMQRIVRAFRDLPIHVLIVCAQKYSQDELKRYHYKPALTGQLADQIQGMMDMVGWLVVGTEVVDEQSGRRPRRLMVQPNVAPKADAKCRFASYPKAFFDDPTMKSIMEATGFLK